MKRSRDCVSGVFERSRAVSADPRTAWEAKELSFRRLAQALGIGDEVELKSHCVVVVG
ncbi:MAG: hypothetical protein ACLRVB_14670 [Blautia sp.]